MIKKLKYIDFYNAVSRCVNGKITSIAPLGMAGDAIILSGGSSDKTSRVSQVSVRLYCKSTELLLTDVNGSFIFYGKLDNSFGAAYIAKEWHRLYKRHKKDLYGMLNAAKTKYSKHPKLSIGFKMIDAYFKN
jgi:hypothetical protein